MAKNEMVRQHHQLNGHESEQTPGDSGGLRSLTCCSPRGHKELAAASFALPLNSSNFEALKCLLLPETHLSSFLIIKKTKLSGT